ncbi:MAG: hypothetical protein DMG81_20790 [Acidobacteria bacterium]|nr:MAG: hypothetical protein DMG81_20790 [Acidobacteriota bacterium]
MPARRQTLISETSVNVMAPKTYRVATWTADESSPGSLQVVEDHQLAFTAQITEHSDAKLRLQQQPTRSHETREVTFSALEGEFVCPDPRK